MVGGIRRRSYSNEKMDTKAKGGHCTRLEQICTLAKPASILHRCGGSSGLLSGMVQRTGSTLILVGLFLLSFSNRILSPRLVFFSFAFLYRLPSSPRGSQGWIFDHERASEFQISAILVVVIRADRNSWGSTCDIEPLAPVDDNGVLGGALKRTAFYIT